MINLGCHACEVLLQVKDVKNCEYFFESSDIFHYLFFYIKYFYFQNAINRYACCSLELQLGRASLNLGGVVLKVYCNMHHSWTLCQSKYMYYLCIINLSMINIHLFLNDECGGRLLLYLHYYSTNKQINSKDIGEAPDVPGEAGWCHLSL